MMYVWQGLIRDLEAIWGNSVLFLVFTATWLCGIGSAVMFSKPEQYQRILFDMLIVFDVILVFRLVAVAIATA